jgi:hypothetical protein
LKVRFLPRSPSFSTTSRARSTDQRRPCRHRIPEADDRRTGNILHQELRKRPRHERDVIFISTTYGPDDRGNQFQRFGPINGSNGHRRLNVLFTRSKRRTVVFTSLDPDRIHTTADSTWGLRALKKYLIYARDGILQQPDNGSDQPTNDFEQSVGNVLKDRGYEIVPQVGVAGFFIDLGVKHPGKPGTFLLGIECDGASYHSARSARDRDRLRQEILEDLGWKIHRICRRIGSRTEIAKLNDCFAA